MDVWYIVGLEYLVQLLHVSYWTPEMPAVIF